LKNIWGVKEQHMLEVNAVNQYYGGSHILRDVSFQAPIGECSVVLGRNGVGKTTLLKCLMGILPIKSGQIVLDGKDISKLSPEQRVRAGLAYVPQGRDIFSTLTVEENILIGMAKFSGAKAKKVPEYLYEIFPILHEMKHRRGGDLSGGQQQQLAIARALVSEPKVLILDEPTEGIQPSIIKDIGRVIRKLADGGEMAIILVEQFYDFAEELADGYTVMARGQVIAQGRGVEMPEKGIKDLVAI
jgi:urea transport system ATP-binding protein